MTLQAQFLSEECTRDVRDLIRAALEDGKRGIGPRTLRFEFNRFDITLDFDVGEALIEDVLDPGNSGIQRIPMDRFSVSMEDR